ncbi:hypothetical protein KR018_006279 [Drosophila ironensis]|nr:hypothetical protein KR018_006279 [Drosophila ironensis]
MGRMFQLQENCLRAMGHTYPHGSVEASEGKGISVRHIVSLFFVVSAQYPLISFMVYKRDDMEQITACLSVVLTNMLTVVKLTTFMFYKRDFWQMMQCFRDMHKESASPRFRDGYDYVSSANKLASLLGRAYFISCGFTGLYFMLGPIVKIVSSTCRGSTYVRELPMPMKFPFNHEDSPEYELSFLYIVLVTAAVVAYASAVDGLFISFAINLRAHFKTLQRIIKQFNYAGSVPETQSRLKSFVIYHEELLFLSKRLRAVYIPIVFGQFFITSLQVGVIIYQLVTHMNSVMDLLVYLSFFGSIMLQLFMYCYGGEIIKVESLQVDIAVRLSNWNLATPKVRKSLAFVVTRSQREVQIRAGFYDASLANFVGICRTALSLITLIKSIE